MKELYIEDLANRGGPESCVCVREGVGEALTGVRVGLAIEPRNQKFGVLTLFRRRKATSPVAMDECEWLADPARSENHGMCASAPGARTGRSSGRPSKAGDAPSWMVRGVAYRPVAGREGNATAVSPR
jgi:hypothetical protein